MMMTRRDLASVPKTEGQLFDHLHRRFGWGDYDELYSDVPYWKWRQIEVTKIKRSLKARRIAVEDVYYATEYCWHHGIRIDAVTWLYQYIYPARSWFFARQRALAGESFDDEYEDAMRTAYEQDDQVWVDRLSRAQGQARTEALEAWKQHQQQR